MPEHGILRGGEFFPGEVVMARAAQGATALDALGVRTGDPVGLMLRNDVAMLEAAFAAATIGAMPVPINWHWKPDEVEYILQDSKAKALVVHADLVHDLRAVLPPELAVRVVPTPADVAAAYEVPIDHALVPDGMVDWNTWIDGFEPWSEAPRMAPSAMVYTSGTTGRPKGVRRESPEDPEDPRFMRAMQSLFTGLGIEGGMRTAITGPMYHSAPYAYAMNAFRLGGFVVLMPRFDPEGLLRLVEEHRLTHLHMVPTMFVRLLRLPDEVKQRYDLSSLHTVVHGAAPCAPDVKRAMIDWWGPVIREYYGGTDGGLVASCTGEEWLSHPGSVGRILPGATVRILDADGREQPPGEAGEIYMRVDGLPDFTYEGMPEARREIERDGLVSMGDVGYLDEDGFLYICDRKRDMVISGGVNVYPAEIEAVLATLDGVRDVAVFGIPDAEYGEALCAAVEVDEGSTLSEDDVKSHVRERLAGYKVPRAVEFHALLPREESGKIFKRKLRDPYWERVGRSI